jgi:protein PET117
MSTASKITLGLSVTFAVSALVGINYLQRIERAALRQGPIKDAERLKTKKQLLNEKEQLEQIELRKKYEQLQPLTGEIIRGEETVDSKNL